MADNNEKIIKDAQYRKGLSIAFFNAANVAIEIVKKEFEFRNADENKPDVEKRLRFWRDWLLEEHKNYYATVIANVGVNFKVEETIKKLESTKSLAELQNIWLSLSEDERRNDAVIKVKEEM